MEAQKIEDRVAKLEAEVTYLKGLLEVPSRETLPWWEQITGTFADSHAFDEAMRLGEEYGKKHRHPEGGT
ncbi:MAG: hypothetical protein IGS48_19115 [Oscillatoriales cyanobacterium C42_A2020_001]|nr:hypothetical protein [Leptolyngbyaceae cyanobacterium C42_A2020_001]